MLAVLGNAASAVLWAQRTSRPCTVTMPRGISVSVPTAYRDCEVDRVAKFLNHARVVYTPPDNAPGDWICERAVMVFVVDTSGRPDPRTVKIEATTRLEWATAVVEALQRIRYRPALLAGRPVRQVVRYERSALIPLQTILSSSRMATSSERWKPC